METSPEYNVTKEMARMREGARPEFTIADALAEAEWLEKTPDGFLAPAVAKQTIRALHAALQSSPCFYKGVKLGIPTFTFLAYDKAGHIGMREWAYAAQAHGARPEKYQSALKLVREWEFRTDLAWPT